MKPGAMQCCETCPFNSLNSPEAQPGPAQCTIRDFAIGNPFATTCVNHPQSHGERDPIPVGPVFQVVGDGQYRAVRPPLDTPAVRAHLLALAAELPETTHAFNLFGPSKDEAALLQLGELREPAAREHLERLAALAATDTEESPLSVAAKRLAGAARVGLQALDGTLRIPPQGAAPAPTREQLEAAVQHAAADLKRAMDARRDALVGRDRKALERILAPGFAYTNASGEKMTRDEYLALYVDSGRMTWTSQELSQVDLSLFGDTAVVTCLVHDVATWDGAPLDAWFRATHVWKARERRWVMLAGHACTAAPPGGPV